MNKPSSELNYGVFLKRVKDPLFRLDILYELDQELSTVILCSHYKELAASLLCFRLASTRCVDRLLYVCQLPHWSAQSPVDNLAILVKANKSQHDYGTSKRHGLQARL